MIGPRRGVRGLRRLVQIAASMLRICYLRAAFGGLSVGFDSFIGPGCEVRVARGGRVVLHGVSVGRGCQIIAGPGALVEVAARSIGPHSVIVAREKVTIGPGSLLAEMSVVRDADLDRPDGAPLTDGHHRSSAIAIGNDVWLATRATVLRGVTIGDAATVGAGAVVTADVAAGQCVVGIPARPINEKEFA